MEGEMEGEMVEDDGDWFTLLFVGVFRIAGGRVLMA